MRRLLVGILSGAVIAAASPATCEENEVAGQRYALSPVEGGMLRLDKQSGAVSLCARRGEAWSCEPVEDKGKAAEDRLRALEEENTNLKAHIENLEAMLNAPPKDADKSGNAPPTGSLQIPSEQDIDKAFDYAERVFKKFRERLKKLEETPRAPETAPAPAPEGGSGNL